MMRTQDAPTIRLADYTPPAFTIDHVTLDFALAAEATRVRAVLSMRRTGGETEALRLDGDELKLLRLSLDGVERTDFTVDDTGLTLPGPHPEQFLLEILTEVAPKSNRKLMGLYQSQGVFCTQCEAQGFRRITYFLDRPDVLATYEVRMEADRADCPVLLSNGNPGESGELPGGRHYAIWHDPWPKPCYLFALVAGRLDVLKDDFTTASGRAVSLGIYVEPGKSKMAAFAMDSLKRSMVWDEEVYGREYDLDVFNIVAVSDFNMGAMENKGLNVFNDKYVLASPDLATDADRMHIEAIIAHEYFHNWTGNRITCRDWFQLCLKEGLTVFRDQEFSADQRSRAVQRITQVRTLKAGQFPEDAGPLAHPVRPQEYREINNFYTATVYQKGAELVRMLATMAGPEGYRAALDLYFERHDGEAAVVEDFLACFNDACGLDTTQFALWYQQAGTPEVTVRESWKDGTFTLDFEQHIPDTPGQTGKAPMVIPIRYGLLGADGADLDVGDDLFVLREARDRLTFEGLEARPTPSLLRRFSAPIRLLHDESATARTFRAQHDSDPYNRWAALNGLALDTLAAAARGEATDGMDGLIEGAAATAFDETLDPDFRAQALLLPSAQDIARHMRREVDPEAVSSARLGLVEELGQRLGAEGLALCHRLAKTDGTEAEEAAARSLKNALWPTLVRAHVEGALESVQAQYANADGMTDRLAALTTLLTAQDDGAIAQSALDTFEQRYAAMPLVIDKWFAVQASMGGASPVDRVRRLSERADFTLDNPNRARSLLGTFAAGNLTGFHAADGAGYRFFGEQIVAIDAINPQLAARLLGLMDMWTMMDTPRRAMARAVLETIAAADLSTDTQEMVDRALGADA